MWGCHFSAILKHCCSNWNDFFCRWVWFIVSVLYLSCFIWLYLLNSELQTGCITWYRERDICNIFATISIDLNFWWVQAEIPVYLGAQEEEKTSWSGFFFSVFKKKKRTKSINYGSFVFLLFIKLHISKGHTLTLFSVMMYSTPMTTITHEFPL